MTERASKSPPSLKQRFENHPVPFIIGICAVVVVAMASLAGYLTTNALAVQKGELEEQFRADRNRALAQLRAELEARIAAESEANQSLVARLDALKAENENLRQATQTFFRCREEEKCLDFFIQGLIRPVDVDDIMATSDVVRIDNGRIFAPRFSDSPFRYVRRPYGALARFFQEAGFDLDTAAPPETAQPSEHIWFLGDPVPIEGHARFVRFAPHFSVLRLKILAGRGDETVDSVFNAFNLDLKARNGPDYRGMRPQIRQIESLRNEALFAHYQTVLRNVRIGGQERRRAFLNEMIFFVRADDGSPDVFVIRCAFLSNGRDVENSSDWANVFNWWSRLVIQA